MFDCVLKKVIKWALRMSRVNETLVQAVMWPYDEGRTKMRIGKSLSEAFDVKEGCTRAMFCIRCCLFW